MEDTSILIFHLFCYIVQFWCYWQVKEFIESYINNFHSLKIIDGLFCFVFCSQVIGQQSILGASGAIYPSQQYGHRERWVTPVHTYNGSTLYAYVHGPEYKTYSWFCICQTATRIFLLSCMKNKRIFYQDFRNYNFILKDKSNILLDCKVQVFLFYAPTSAIYAAFYLNLKEVVWHSRVYIGLACHRARVCNSDSTGILSAVKQLVVSLAYIDLTTKYNQL